MVMPIAQNVPATAPEELPQDTKKETPVSSTPEQDETSPATSSESQDVFITDMEDTTQEHDHPLTPEDPEIEATALEEDNEPPVVIVQPASASMFSSKREKLGFWFFVAPVVLMSFVSMRHLVEFFSIGNDKAMSWLLGGAFELASIATIVAMVLLRKINKTALWSILVLLYLLQLVGNVYSPFAHIDPNEAIRLFQFFGLEPSQLSAQRIVAVAQGAILPTVTLILSKLLSDYLKVEEKRS